MLRSMVSRAIVVVFLLWAAIYLPALGSLPIKGEEGRRILPAVSMMQSGNYLVPEVGGAAYFSKPPLINWLIAASFKLFRTPNEWTARLPSAVCVLLVALAFVTVARQALGSSGSIFAAVIWLTSAGIIEKGRLAEIEAVYVSLFALAIICWLSFWQTNRSAWLVWIPASLFLGLGLLTKGPVHLIFFYAVMISIAWQANNWRIVFHPAHLIALILMVGIFAAWAIPFVQATNSTLVAAKWSGQFSGRLAGHDFHFGSWILNIPRGLVYFLPWTIFLPFVRPSQFVETKASQFARALIWGAAVPFIVVNLIPGALPRYSMPALVPVCWLLASVFASLEDENTISPFAIPGFSLKQRWRLVGTIAVLAAVVIAVYASVVVPRLQQRETVKQLAEQIDRAIGPNEPVYALDPNYQPIFFYLRTKLIYRGQLAGVPGDAKYLLTRPDRAQQVSATDQWMPRSAKRVLQVTDYRKQSLILFRIE